MDPINLHNSQQLAKPLDHALDTPVLYRTGLPRDGLDCIAFIGLEKNWTEIHLLLVEIRAGQSVNI